MRVKHTITFSRGGLDSYKELCRISKEVGSSSFVWKNMLVGIEDAEDLIKKLEASPNLTITIID